MKRIFLIAALMVGSIGYAEERVNPTPIPEPAPAKAEVKDKMVPVQVVQGAVNYLAGRKLSDVLNVFMELKQKADKYLEEYPQAKEIPLPESLVAQVMTLMRQEGLFQVYMALQAAPYDQRDKPKPTEKPAE
jgi:hypothetical protein